MTAAQTAGSCIAPADLTTVEVPGSGSTDANGINDAGQIVGTFMDGSAGRHGFLYDAGTFTTIDVPGGQFNVAFDIGTLAKL